MTAGCERCRHTPGWEETRVEGVLRLRRCACWDRAHAFAPSVPREFRDAHWATWHETADNRHAMRAGRELLAPGDDGPDLYLCGPVGSGKTRLACTVLNEAWQSDKRSVAFVRVPMLLYRLQPRDGVDQFEMLDRLIETALVVLDDLGAERETATDYTRRTLLMLYEARHDAGRRTVWTSNRTPRAIGEFMGDDRLASRIAGRCRIVALEGRDWRLRQAEPHRAAGNAGGAGPGAAGAA